MTGPNPGLTKYVANADRSYYYVLSVERKEDQSNQSGRKIVCEPAMTDAEICTQAGPLHNRSR